MPSRCGPPPGRPAKKFCPTLSLTSELTANTKGATIDAIHVFFAEIVVCLAVSALILARLQRLLRRIGDETCERGGGATDFWIAYTQLMMVIAPILLVAWLSRAGQNMNVVEQLKSSLGVVLTGQVLGLVLVGRAVWKSIVRPAPAAPIPMGAPTRIVPDATSA